MLKGSVVEHAIGVDRPTPSESYSQARAIFASPLAGIAISVVGKTIHAAASVLKGESEAATEATLAGQEV